MAKGIQFLVNGDSMAARNLVFNTMSQDKWRIDLTNDWEAKAERGSKAGSFWGGSFAGKAGRHCILKIIITTNTHGNTIIELSQKTSGASGGMIGVSQANDVYQMTFDNIGRALSNAGIYLDSRRL
ncbi:MAG: hypothetical protein FWC11_02310 [Firmicutes bacterium]|nr:hypothetical protein [Bacillota bacterium]MCL2255672.1 hypothetical protein [Bacillota bacterium]